MKAAQVDEAEELKTLLSGFLRIDPAKRMQFHSDRELETSPLLQSLWIGDEDFPFLGKYNTINLYLYSVTTLKTCYGRTGKEKQRTVHSFCWGVGGEVLVVAVDDQAVSAASRSVGFISTLSILTRFLFSFICFNTCIRYSSVMWSGWSRKVLTYPLFFGHSFVYRVAD